ncbi:hypothetical protein ABIF25_004373 [Bradyrhizobium elkanii]
MSPMVWKKPLRPAGPADLAEDHVARSVVAPCDGGLAKLGKRHARGDVLLGDGRVGQDILGLEPDLLIEAGFAAVDPVKHRSRGQRLEGAAHREPLVAAPARAQSRFHVKRGDAEPAAGRQLDARKLLLQLLRRLAWSCRCALPRQSAGHRKAQRAQSKCPSRQHVESPVGGANLPGGVTAHKQSFIQRDMRKTWS